MAQARSYLTPAHILGSKMRSKNKMPVIGKAIDRPILTHGGDDDPVANRDAPDCEGTQQVYIRDGAVVADPCDTSGRMESFRFFGTIRFANARPRGIHQFAPFNEPIKPSFGHPSTFDQGSRV